MNRLRKRQVKFSLWYVVLAVLIVTLFQSYVLRQAEPRVVAWSELVALVETGKVKEAMLEEDRIVGVLKEAPPSERGKALVEATRLPGIDESSLVGQLRARGVQIRAL